MVRPLFALLIACLVASAPAGAQDRETLADIRQELSVLFVEIQRLRQELSTTGSPSGTGAGGSTLERVGAIEAELRRLTQATEALEIRVNRVVTDGTNRVGDLEFRLCELESDCDIGSLGQTPTLGGGELPQTGGLGSDVGSDEPVLAAAEQSDFDRAMTAFEAGEHAEAARLFEAYTETYPGGALSAEAHFWRGESEAAQNAWSVAARAYLDSFSGAPEAPRAPQALLRLGTSLAELGQSEEACLTLNEVGVRYPGNPSVLEAQAAMTRLRCN